MKMILADIESCYGCTACYSACPVSAISMNRNEKGYFIPVIDEKKCLNCDLCKRICPRLNYKKTENEFEAYAVKNKDDVIRKASQSGGAFWPFCEYVFRKKGIVYGCILDSSCYEAIHIRTTSLEEAKTLHGSKYIQSNLGITFNLVKQDLNDGLLVLFSGTPCQVAGLKAFLRRSYENLITVDLVCYEVSSPLIWREYIEKLEKDYNGKCIHACFRDKKYGWHSHFETIEIKKDNGKNIRIKDKSFARIFGARVTTRESCFSCQFKSIYRVGDFTIGDCWGIEKTYDDFSDVLGVSLLLINNQHFPELKNFLLKMLEHRRLLEEQAIQPALIQQCTKSIKTNEFWEIYSKHGISKVLANFGTLKYRINSFFRNW